MDIFNTSTNTTLTDDNRGLTFDKLMATINVLNDKYKTVFYMASDYAPISEDGKIIGIPNDGATSSGYDIVCHTSQVERMIEALSSEYIVRPLDEAERRRRMNTVKMKIGI